MKFVGLIWTLKDLHEPNSKHLETTFLTLLKTLSNPKDSRCALLMFDLPVEIVIFLTSFNSSLFNLIDCKTKPFREEEWKELTMWKLIIQCYYLLFPCFPTPHLDMKLACEFQLKMIRMHEDIRAQTKKRLILNDIGEIIYLPLHLLLLLLGRLLRHCITHGELPT